MARVLNTDMKSMKSWIDNHPEYVLILLSDHGVDEYGMAGKNNFSIHLINYFT